MATTAPTTASTVTSDKPKAKSELIQCTVIKKFFSEENQLLEPGAPYNYTPKDDEPFPWNLLRPNDSSLEEELEKEYKEFKKDKQKEIRKSQDIRTALSTLGASGE